MPIGKVTYKSCFHPPGSKRNMWLLFTENTLVIYINIYKLSMWSIRNISGTNAMDTSNKGHIFFVSNRPRVRHWLMGSSVPRYHDTCLWPSTRLSHEDWLMVHTSELVPILFRLLIQNPMSLSSRGFILKKDPNRLVNTGISAKSTRMSYVFCVNTWQPEYDLCVLWQPNSKPFSVTTSVTY